MENINNDGAVIVQTEVTNPDTLPEIYELFSRSWQFVKTNFSRIVWAFIISGLLMVPGMILSGWLNYLVLTEADTFLVYLVAFATVLINIISFVLSTALIAITTVYGKSVSLSESLHKMWRLWWPLTLTLAVAYAVVAAGFIFLVIPGIILSILISPLLWVWLEEGLTMKAAIARSFSLVTGRWWGVTGRLCILLFAFLGLYFLGSLALFLVIGFGFSVGLSQLANWLALLLIGAVGIVVFIVFLMLLGAASFFVSRYSYEIYRGLRDTVSPTTFSWWSGTPLTVLTVVGVVLGGLYLLASPYIIVEDIKNNYIENAESRMEGFRFDGRHQPGGVERYQDREDMFDY